MAVRDEQVKSLEKGTAKPPPPAADAALASLRRSVAPLTDIAQIISRYNAFLERYKGTSAADSAQGDLDLWKMRQTKNMVKVGSSWITPEEQSAVLQKVVSAVDPIREMIKDGRVKEADAALTELLALDPSNVAGLYLRGVLYVKQGQLMQARAPFQRVRELVPDHAPTLNNLAVILFQQRQQPAALVLYDLALASAPADRRILDNVAEALHALPPEFQQSAAAQRLARRFFELDGQLQKQLADQGLYRWGGSYVTKAQIDEVKRGEEGIKARLDALSSEYNRTRDRIGEIDIRIKTNQDTIDRINRDRTYINTQGQRIQSSPPSIYYDLRRQNDLLKEEQAMLNDRLGGFDQRADEIRQDAPSPTFRGRQEIIEVDGTPLGLPSKLAAGAPDAGKPGAATQPVTQPAQPAPQ